MGKEFQKYLKFFQDNGGTGKQFNFNWREPN